MAVLASYQWLVIVGSIAAFAFGWGTGSNDVANAFGTSVGSKALTLKQAVVVASIFEFGGALLLGRVNTNVIAGGVADVSAFQQQPEIYAYGMLCALAVGGVWQGIASFYELNVSATHCIVGAIMGFGLVHAGRHGVIWARRDPGNFPPYQGVIAIILSWFFSPLLSGALSAILFAFVRWAVLRRPNAYQLSFFVLPPLVLLTVFVNVFFVFTKGITQALNQEGKGWSAGKAAWVAAVTAVGVAAVTAVGLMPLLKWYTDRKFAFHERSVSGDKEDLESASEQSTPSITWLGRARAAAMHGMEVDVHHVIETDVRVAEIHAHAEVFSPKVEHAFSYLQIFSASAVSFAHGSGEVGYMTGPLTTIWDVYQTGTLTKTVKPPVWVVVICALGLVVGLATYGYKVTRAMGVKLAKLSPSRGFAAELATAGVITIGAQYGLPTSSSQCITGAIMGVGLLEGAKGVNWIVFVRQFVSWVSTVFLVGVIVAALFAQGTYAPSEIDGRAVNKYEAALGNLTNTVLADYNSTLFSYQSSALAGNAAQLSAQQWAALNDTIATTYAAVARGTNFSTQGTITPDVLLGQLQTALGLIESYAVNTLGQPDTFPGADVCFAPSGGNLTACVAPNTTFTF